MTTNWTCPNCHHKAELEPVEVWRKAEARWENSSVRECSRCKKPFGGTLSDRLAVIQTVYDRASFDLLAYSTEARAVWEAKFLADTVPELVEALTDLLAQVEDATRRTGLPLVNPERALAAISKTDPRPSGAPEIGLEQQ